MTLMPLLKQKRDKTEKGQNVHKSFIKIICGIGTQIEFLFINVASMSMGATGRQVGNLES